MKRVMMALLSLTLLTACGQAPEQTNAGPEGLTLSLQPVDHAGGECRIRQVARIDQDRHDLYMMDGETQYRDSRSDQFSRIPLQLQFRGIDGVQTQDLTTLTGIDADCSDLAISVEVGSCLNQAREPTSCPTVQLTGSEHFKGLTLERPGA